LERIDLRLDSSHSVRVQLLLSAQRLFGHLKLSLEGRYLSSVQPEHLLTTGNGTRWDKNKLEDPLKR